jgi:hypothetical protein
MIEDLLAEITDRDWYLYSAYSHPYDRPSAFTWECTLRNAEASLVAFGQGPSLDVALSQALDNIDRAQPGVLPTFTVSEAPKADVASILAILLPQATITRRKL